MPPFKRLVLEILPSSPKLTQGPVLCSTCGNAVTTHSTPLTLDTKATCQPGTAGLAHTRPQQEERP